MRTGKVKDLNKLILTLKPYLRQYLERVGTEFVNGKFQCPNRANHANNDETPSAGFNPQIPGEIVVHCFSCGFEGDVFKSAHVLEGKPIDGQGFILENVLYLARLFEIPFEVEPLSDEEQTAEKTYDAISWVMNKSHNALWKSPA